VTESACLPCSCFRTGNGVVIGRTFTGVDIKTEKTMIDLRSKAAGDTILISTHDLASVTTFCDQVILINRTILAYGDTSKVFTEDTLQTFGGAINDPSLTRVSLPVLRSNGYSALVYTAASA